MKKVSDLLRETREERKLSLASVASATKIKQEFLENIERGNFISLPSESYAMGFVKNYAKFLDLSLSTVVPLFRREYNAKKNIPIIPEFRKSQSKFRRRFLFSPKGLIVIMVIILLSIYIFFQYSSVIFAPKLEIKSPNSSLISKSNVIEVSGNTDPYATVFIEGEEVYVGLDGSFKKSVYEFSGNATITILAKNRFGKESKKIINFKVE